MLKSFLDSGDILAPLCRRSAAAQDSQRSSGRAPDNPGETRRRKKEADPAARQPSCQLPVLGSQFQAWGEVSPAGPVRTFLGYDPNREEPNTGREPRMWPLQVEGPAGGLGARAS